MPNGESKKSLPNESPLTDEVDYRLIAGAPEGSRVSGSNRSSGVGGTREVHF